MTSVVLAGGGTAGHTSPLIATAEALKELEPTIKMTAIGTAKGLETRVVPEAGLDLQLIPPVPMPRKITGDLFKVPFRLRRAVRAAGRILDQVDAQAVVGMGGYVSMPVYFAARNRRIPVIIHEQNARPGLANRVAAKFAAAVLTAFPDTALPKAQFVGMPVRAAISDLATASDREDRARAARKSFGLDTSLPVLLVSGGSQGARSLNQAILDATDRLLADGVQVLHVWGPKNFPADAQSKTDKTTGARYVPVAFVDAMDQAYAAATIMLARSGAGTVVETAMVGLPTILVPLPIGNGEQALNAKPVVDAGAGVLIADADLDADIVVGQVQSMLPKAAQMSEAGRKLMSPTAARTVAETILDAIEKKERR